MYNKIVVRENDDDEMVGREGSVTATREKRTIKEEIIGKERIAVPGMCQGRGLQR